MDFTIEPLNIIKTVKRKATVVIAGIAISIAANAAPISPVLSDLAIDEPLVTVIARSVTTPRVPMLDLEKIGEIGNRIASLEASIASHGKDMMDDKANALWNNLLSASAAIPFDKVFAQYDPYSSSIFFSYNFASGHRIDATVYSDEEDQDVYFSIASKGEVFFQNALPRDIFFKNVISTWRNIYNDAV